VGVQEADESFPAENELVIVGYERTSEDRARSVVAGPGTMRRILLLRQNGRWKVPGTRALPVPEAG
jgi:hypothetical protein